MTLTLITDRPPTAYFSPAAAQRKIGRVARQHTERPVALIVDADQDCRYILTQLLAQIHYTVVSTDNVDDACRIATEILPMLVVTDLRIGLHDTRLIPIELRRIPALEWIPMVVSSAWGLPQDSALAESVGADLFTTTPLDFRAIKELAAKLLQRPSRFAGD